MAYDTGLTIIEQFLAKHSYSRKLATSAIPLKAAMSEVVFTESLLRDLRRKVVVLTGWPTRIQCDCKQDC